MPNELTGSPFRGNAGLVDVLDRVLDKGLVVAGDIKVSLAEVELLTIRIRLIICSVERAMEIGLDWWKYDRHLSPGREQVLQENLELRLQLQDLERRLATLTRKNSRRGRRLAVTKVATRVARALLSSISPPRVSRASGSSALGSAWAIEPPSVPRLRVW